MNREAETRRRPRNAPQTSKWQQHLHHLSQGACFTGSLRREKGAWKPGASRARVRSRPPPDQCARGFPGDTRFTPPLSGERAPLWCSAFALQVPGEEGTKLGAPAFHPPLNPKVPYCHHIHLLLPEEESCRCGGIAGEREEGQLSSKQVQPLSEDQNFSTDSKMCWWEASLGGPWILENASQIYLLASYCWELLPHLCPLNCPHFFFSKSGCSFQNVLTRNFQCLEYIYVQFSETRGISTNALFRELAPALQSSVWSRGLESEPQQAIRFQTAVMPSGGQRHRASMSLTTGQWKGSKTLTPIQENNHWGRRGEINCIRRQLRISPMKVQTHPWHAIIEHLLCWESSR